VRTKKGHPKWVPLVMFSRDASYLTSYFTST